MAKVKIQGHASGTGILTVTAPNTSTDRTITLPDATGTLLNSDGSGASLTGLFNPDGAVTINDTGADVDFRVESDGNANMLLVDGGANTVLIGGTTNTSGGYPFKIGDSGHDGELAMLADGDASQITSYDRTAGAYHPLIIYASTVTRPYQPSCAVARSSNHSGSGIVVFDYVNHNQGSHYSTANGKFTAPVAGKYLVNIFGMSTSDATVDMAVKINGASSNNLVPYSSSTGGTFNGVSGGGILGLSANDYIQVYIGVSGWYGTTAGRHNGFSVHLLS